MDGRPQQSYISKEESASPTCSNNALMLVVIQAAHKGRKIRTADVSGAFLHAEMDDFVMIKLQCQIMDILCEMKPEYKKFVVYENGKATIYMQLMKTLCGYIKSALLWCDLFTGELREIGYKLNPYNKCGQQNDRWQAVHNSMVDVAIIYKPVVTIHRDYLLRKLYYTTLGL